MTRKNQPDDEDAERDFQEGSLAFAVNKDLESALRDTDSRLLLFIAVGIALVFLARILHAPNTPRLLVAATGLLFILGGLGFTFYSVITRKQKVAIKYGLKCLACGHLPKSTDQIYQAAELEQCPSCRKRLSPQMP
jgi:hypothetical protein